MSYQTYALIYVRVRLHNAGLIRQCLAPLPFNENWAFEEVELGAGMGSYEASGTFLAHLSCSHIVPERLVNWFTGLRAGHGGAQMTVWNEYDPDDAPPQVVWLPDSRDD